MITLIEKKLSERRARNEARAQQAEIDEFMAAFDAALAKQPSEADSEAEMFRIASSLAG